MKKMSNQIINYRTQTRLIINNYAYQKLLKKTLLECDEHLFGLANKAYV